MDDSKLRPCDLINLKVRDISSTSVVQSRKIIEQQKTHNEVRLENSQKLLVETNMPIAQLGYESSFPNPSYFTQQFHSFFDEMPSGFIKNHQII